MKLKRNSLIVLLLGVLVLVSGCIIPVIYWISCTSHNGAMGIIGGASAPTYTFMLLSLFHGLPFVFVLVGVSLVVSSLFCLLFLKTVKKHCSLKSSALALGLSGVGALGLVCAFTWFTIVSFQEAAKHPISYPVSVLLGILLFFTFAVLTFLYFKQRKTNWSIKGIVIDALTSVVYLPAFFFVFTYLYEIIT